MADAEGKKCPEMSASSRRAFLAGEEQKQGLCGKTAHMEVMGTSS